METITAAAIAFEEETPVSLHYDDVYFSKAGGVAESDYVFVQGNRLPERWQAWGDTQASLAFTIVETGFGTGLNFILAASRFLQYAPPDKILHFVSFEKHPLTPKDLARFHHQWSELSAEFLSLSQALIQYYPPAVAGFHRLPAIKNRIFLTLIYGDISITAPQLKTPVSAWFLDGFSPRKNPDMWNPVLFQTIQRLSTKDTTLATFTAASFVHQALQETGAVVKKIKGFGKKREMITASFIKDPNESHCYTLAQSPWNHFTYTPAPPKKAMIIGAGLAGCHTAFTLAERGFQVQLIEQHAQVAGEASGNLAALVYTHFSIPRVPINLYYETAFFHTLRFLAQLKEQYPDFSWDPKGIIEIPHQASAEVILNQLFETGFWQDYLLPLSPDEIKAVPYLSEKKQIYKLNQTGQVRPKHLCEILVRHPNIEFIPNTKVTQLAWENAWHVTTENHQHYEAPICILTNAYHAKYLNIASHFPLSTIRGQLTYLAENQKTARLAYPVNYGGYLTMPVDGWHCVGASFKPKSRHLQLEIEEQNTNLQMLTQQLPELAADFDASSQTLLPGRTAFRTSTPDYLPIIGPIPDEAAIQTAYAPLRLGQLKKQAPTCPILPNIYINAGHGSRGVVSSALAAEIIAAHISHEPFPIDQQTLNAINPARFLIRAIKRKQN
jgi:tRNA 5-methylaminomethyl-2-thiouridine biosynthesis bifunctional protein